MDKREIAQLVEKSRRGDNDAFGKLYQLTEKQAYFIALRIAKNEDDALDILQDCYIKAMQKMDTLENPENFVAWFNQIVSNTSKNYVVKSKPMLFRDDEDEAAENILHLFSKIISPWFHLMMPCWSHSGRFMYAC